MRQVTVHRAHTVPGRPPIQVDVGQEVHVGERDDEWPEFVFVTTPGGSGWVPARHLTMSGNQAVVHTPYDTTELATQIGDILDVVIEDHQSGWLWCRGPNGSEGWVPLRTVGPTP